MHIGNVHIEVKPVGRAELSTRMSRHIGAVAKEDPVHLPGEEPAVLIIGKAEVESMALAVAVHKV